jgi:hypothetical protein
VTGVLLPARQDFSLSYNVRPALLFTHFHVRRFFLRRQNCRDVKLTVHNHLLPKLRMVELYVCMMFSVKHRTRDRFTRQVVLLLSLLNFFPHLVIEVGNAVVCSSIILIECNEVYPQL